ncbi:MAG: hypothetical protein AAF170_08515 [Bacteroidota bacterium]
MIRSRLLSYGLGGLSFALAGLVVFLYLGRQDARRGETRATERADALAVDTTRLGSSLRSVRGSLDRQTTAVRQLELEGARKQAQVDQAVELATLQRRVDNASVQRVLIEPVPAGPPSCPERGAVDYLAARAPALYEGW